MGPIEHTVCQIAFKVEKKYKDEEFSRQILEIATLIHDLETPPNDWETNEDLKKIHKIGHDIRRELKD